MSQFDFNYLLSGLFLNASMTALYHYYLKQFADKPLRRRWPIFAVLCLTAVNLVWFMPYRQVFFYTFTIVLYLMYYLYARLVFGFRQQEGILYTMLYYFLTHFVVRSIDWVSVQIFGTGHMTIGTAFLPAMGGNLLIVILAVGVIVLFRKKLRLLAGYRLGAREFINVVLLGAPLIWFCHSQYLMTVDYLHFPVEIILMRAVISLCAVYALTGIISASKNQAEEMEVQRIQGLLESQYEQFKLKRESSELIMTKCHDLQKQLKLFETTKQPEYIDSYREELQQTIHDFDSFYETGNATIDALLSDAGLKCRGDKVQLICLLDGRKFDFIQPIDLCTIFGNALDNAIESVQRISDPAKRIIRVKSIEEKGYLFLRFENYYEHELKELDGELGTSKSDKDNHGYGLKSIRLAVKKYSGQMSSEPQNGLFRLTITFPSKSHSR